MFCVPLAVFLNLVALIIYLSQMARLFCREYRRFLHQILVGNFLSVTNVSLGSIGILANNFLVQ